MTNKFSNEIYLGVDLFGGDKDSSDVRLQTSKIVKVRKKQICNFGKVHDIQSGEFSRYDKALVDGKWGSCYSCLKCLDSHLIQFEGYEVDLEQ